jgi:hypothetical protein
MCLMLLNIHTDVVYWKVKHFIHVITCHEKFLQVSVTTNVALPFQQTEYAGYTVETRISSEQLQSFSNLGEVAGKF